MAKTYHITLLNEEEGINTTIAVAEHQTILDVAEEHGLDLPYTCRVGRCSACTGRVKQGTVDQSEQLYLEEEQVKQGFVLTCVSHPKSDCTILTHQEQELN